MAGLTAAELEAVIGVDDAPFEKGLSGMLGKFEGWGGKAGALLAGAGALGGGLFAAGVAGGLSLDEARGRMQAELGLSADESERLGGVAGRLYADAYGENIGEVSDAVSAVVSSIKGMRNASDSEVEAMTATALDFANVFEVDVARAAQVAGVAMQAGLAKNGTEAFDMLTAAMQKVPKQLREDVLDATEEYSQFFGSLGIEGEQAFAMLAAGAEKGMYGIDKVGDAVKEFTIRATDMSSGTKAAYEAVGLNARAMTNDLLAGGDRASGAMDKIVDGLLGIKDPAAQSQAALALFGTPLEDLGTKDIPKFLSQLDVGSTSLGNFEGATARAGKAINDNARTNLTSFVRTLQTGLVEVIGGAVVPVLNTFAATLATAVGPALSAIGTSLGTVAGFLSQHSTAFAVVAGIIGAVFVPALVAMGVQATISGVKTAAGWSMAQAAAVKSLAAQSLAVTRTVAGWVLMGVQSMAQAARMAAAWVIALGPIGWAIAAVVAVVAAVVANWDKVKAVTAAVWSWVSSKTVAAWSAIKAAVSSAVAAVKGVITTVFAAIKAAVTTYVNAWKTVITAAWHAIRAAVSAAVQGVMGAIRGLSAVVGIVRDAFGRAKDGAVSMLGNLLDFVRSLPGKIVDALSGIGSHMLTIGRNIVEGIWQGVQGMAGWLASKLASFASSLVPGPIKKALGINSPSTVMAEQVGRWIPAGIAAGVDKHGGVLDKAMRDLSGRVTVSPGDAAFAGARLGAAQQRAAQPGPGRSGPLFGDVIVRDEADVDMLMSRAGFALTAGTLGA